MNKVDVVCGVLIKNGKYLITQKGGDKDHSLWEFPGGKVNPNETCFEAIYQEIKEELDISIVPSLFLLFPVIVHKGLAPFK